MMPLLEQLKIFHCDPVESTFCDVLQYVPEQLYTDETHEERIYNEMWTGDWWWELQVNNDYFL